MYCIKCEKQTETSNERTEEWNEFQILKGVCKVCNTNKAKKIGLIKKRRWEKNLI